MLPNGNLSDLMYPMTADIYYSTAEQSSFGEMVNTWSFDRVINCSAIKERPDSAIANAISSEKFIEYSYKLDFRTADEILKSSDDISYSITEILITNIKDVSSDNEILVGKNHKTLCRQFFKNLSYFYSKR